MRRTSRFLGDISFLQLAASVLAAVTAAFVASALGLSGTLIGAATVSFVATVGAQFYSQTLSKVPTTRLIRRTTDPNNPNATEIFEMETDPNSEPDEVTEVLGLDAVDTVEAESPADADGEATKGIAWRPIIATTVIVLALALAVVSAIELATGGGPISDGDRSGGTTIGDLFGGRPEPTPSSTTEPTTEPTTPSTSTEPTTTDSREPSEAPPTTRTTTPPTIKPSTPVPPSTEPAPPP